MITLNKTLITLIAIIYAFTLNAQGSVDKMAYQAYLSGSTTLWEKTVEQATSSWKQDPSSENRYKRALAVYGLLNATMKDEDEELFDAYSDLLETDADYLIDSDYRKAEAKAMLSALYGFKIAYSPWTGMFYGPKSSAQLEDALELSPNSALVQKINANYLNFTPEMWGGDLEKALAAYKKSNTLYEEEGFEDNWMYLDNMAWIGAIYKKQDRPQQALQVWERAIELEPSFAWVKNNLIPSVQ